MSHLTQLVVLIPAVLALELPIAAQAVPPAAVRLLDVSGDGVPDKLFLDAEGSIRIAVHSGARRFDPVAQELPQVAAVSDVLAADLDGDSRLDLYFVTRGANLALVGEGYGRFHEATEALGLVDEGPGRTVERRDLDADGAFDLVLHNDGGDVLFWARPGAAFERDGDCPAQAAERPVDPALLPEILAALAEEASHPLSAGGAVEASVGSDEHGRPVVTLRPTRPTAGPGPAGGPVAGTPPSVSPMGPVSGTPPGGRVNGPIDATVGPGLGVNLNTVFVNDNGNEVDSADVIDGALTGADISTSTGDITTTGGNWRLDGGAKAVTHQSAGMDFLRPDGSLGLRLGTGTHASDLWLYYGGNAVSRLWSDQNGTSWDLNWGGVLSLLGGKLTLTPSDDQALDVTAGSIYKSGTLFIHTKGGTNNTALGFEALGNVVSGFDNTATGRHALLSNTTGSGNTASGADALKSNTTGVDNTASGADALFSNTTGNSNTAAGRNALFDNTTGFHNTANGSSALWNNTTGYRNTASGSGALLSNTTGFRNTASGNQALLSNTTGSLNTASGCSALLANTTGARNAASGYAALRYNTTGANNTASGYAALRYNTTGSNNTASGDSALRHNTTGYRNTASGISALRDNTTGFRNMASGDSALLSNTTGSRNTASGSIALLANATGANNTASGYAALAYNTTGSNNTANGYSALRFNKSGYNTASGSDALRSNTTGSRNTASGYAALRSNTTASENTASGASALESNTTGSDNTAIGSDALFSNTTGSRNTASGFRALSSNTAGVDNTASGHIALLNNTTGFRNTASGSSALMLNTTGFNSTAIGSSALFSNTTGANNTASGYAALRFNTTGSGNTASGYGALFYNTTGWRNTAVGVGALNANATGQDNIGLGVNAGSNLTTGSNNIAIGNLGVAGESSTIRIGTSGTQTRAFIAGIRGVTTGGGGALSVLIDANGQLGTVSSSRRFKKDIVDMGAATDNLLELRPVRFRYRQEQTMPDGSEVPMEYGLIAEEVAEVFPDLVVYDEEGDPFTVKYHILSSMLLNELKKLEERFGVQSEEHARELEARARELEELRSRVATLESRVPPPLAALPAGGP